MSAATVFEITTATPVSAKFFKKTQFWFVFPNIDRRKCPTVGMVSSYIRRFFTIVIALISNEILEHCIQFRTVCLERIERER
jgi:hypothetical protein